MQKVANTRGLTLENQAKVFEESYFDQFDAIFCVTREILEAVQSMAHGQKNLDKLCLATHFSKKHQNQDIPDPYFSGPHGFEMIWEIMEDSCQGIIDHFYP